MERSAIQEPTSWVATRQVFQHFREPEGSLPHSQELSTFAYPEPNQSSPHHPILSPQYSSSC
jgi:hypothetical protein